jgi:DNA-binding NtrC family response regulator
MRPAASESAGSRAALPGGRVLLVDDDEAMCEFLTQSLQRQGLRVVAETSTHDALERLAGQDFDVVVSDLKMEGLDGLAFTEQVVQQHAELPVIVMTGSATLDAAVGALRAGAWDFLVKPIDTDLLALSMERARKHRALRGELTRLRRVVSSTAPARMLGESAAMKKVYDLIERVGPGDASALIAGESGTGKELIARALHAASPRRSGPFVAVNCAAVPAALLEAELFGYTKGAFTDARRERKGLFVEADGGTLFLDEIADLPLDMQPKLLRALQERRVRPIGGSGEVPFDARLVTATNRDLEHEVHEKRFREDLWFRINVVRIELPPLRERDGDVLLLARHFIERAAGRADRRVTGLSAEAAEVLLKHDWPGNVRELENCIESAVALTRGCEISVEDLPERIHRVPSPRIVVAVENVGELVTLDELDQRYLGRVLAFVGGNKARTAQILGVDRGTLYRMLNRRSQQA